MVEEKVWGRDPFREARGYFPNDYTGQGAWAWRREWSSCGPAPVVPSLRLEVRSPRDWRMVRSLPPTVMSTSVACASMKPRDWEGIACEKTMKASAWWR